MKKQYRKILSLLLCGALMAGLFAMPVCAAEPQTQAHVHEYIYAAEDFSLQLASEGKCTDGGDHHWTTRVYAQGSVCKAITVYQLYCPVCGAERGYTTDDHTWSNWTESAATCTQDGYRVRSCTLCGEEDRETISATGHKMSQVTVAVTCTQDGISYDKCSVCGYEENYRTTLAAGHKFVDDGNCTTSVRCSVCGAWDGNTFYARHSFGGEYYYDSTGHWQQCQNANCKVMSTPAAHRTTSGSDCTKGTACTICGDTEITGQQHNFENGKLGTSNASGHYIICSNPGCSVTTLVNHTPAPVSSCTDPVKCAVCGYVISKGKAHTYGPVTQGDPLGHERTCTTCGYMEKTSHTGEGDDGNCTTPVACSTCGYVLVPGYAGHDYTSTVWISDGEGGHSSLCSHSGCQSKVTDAHTGGTATCQAAAICTVCGGSYGARASGNHTGGTELRGVKAAAVGAEGYTGDTYCLGCGQQLESGSAIPALAEDHVHSYGTAWVSDSTGHWHICGCGEKSDEAAHDFLDGVCADCGQTDPNYKPVEEHIHTYDGSWSGDSQEHWHECATCGHQADRDTHRFLNDVCIECGMTYVQHQEEEKKEEEAQNPPEPPSVAETYSDVAAGAWYVDAIQTVVDAGLMNGYSETVFGPDDILIRGQMATILYRLADTPDAPDGVFFGDVYATDYYADAVAWAASQEILQGDGVNFEPIRSISRQELATILYRYAAHAGYDVSTGGDIGNYSDGAQVASWAKTAMVWACDAGIITGRDNMTLAPTDTATRAEVATMLYRFMNWQKLGSMA